MYISPPPPVRTYGRIIHACVPDYNFVIGEYLKNECEVTTGILSVTLSFRIVCNISTHAVQSTGIGGGRGGRGGAKGDYPFNRTFTRVRAPSGARLMR